MASQGAGWHQRNIHPRWHGRGAVDGHGAQQAGEQVGDRAQAMGQVTGAHADAQLFPGLDQGAGGEHFHIGAEGGQRGDRPFCCLLYTSDAADD